MSKERIKPEQVIVYMGDGEKDMIREVAHRLNVPHSQLIRSLAFPQIRKIEQLLAKGADPEAVRDRVIK